MEPDEPPITVAREDTPHGEVALRRRGDVLELVVDGAFAMDTVDVSTERELARRALAEHPEPRRVLVGGLGLGFTVREVLAGARVARLDVAELAEPLVRWAGERLVPELAGLEDDGRCRLHVADVADVLAGRSEPAGPWDVVLLDVDNGPGFLVHEHNESLYAGDGLATAYRALAPGGVLVIWSADASPELLAGLAEVAPPDQARAGEQVLSVTREGRTFDYALYTLSRADADADARRPGRIAGRARFGA